MKSKCNNLYSEGMIILISSTKDKINCIRGIMLTNLCPQPGSGAAAPQAGGGHGEAEQTQSRAAVCGAGEELALGCVYRDKQPSISENPREKNVRLGLELMIIFIIYSFVFSRLTNFLVFKMSKNI